MFQFISEYITLFFFHTYNIMKYTLNAFHLFLILIGSLLLCSVLSPRGNCEGMTSGHTSVADVNSYTGPAGNTVYTYPMNDDYNEPELSENNSDLYILKSQVVPPVCPACPSQTSCPRAEPPPPCPPCARCPQPSFECKKVPNYNANNQPNYNANNQPNYNANNESVFMPRPVLTDFSSFGM